jgi:hypothetical protein
VWSFFPLNVFNGLFITISRDRWYHNKRFLFPIILLTAICFMAVIIGLVFGTKSSPNKPNATGKFSDVLFRQKMAVAHSPLFP